MAQLPKLKVGFVIHGLRLPAWSRYVIQKLALCDFSVPVLVILDRKGASQPSFPQLPQKIVRIVWDLYLRVDRHFSGLRTAAFQMDDATPFLRDVPMKIIPPEAASGATTESLRSYELDVLLWLSSGAVHDDLIGKAKHGIWTLDPPPPSPPARASRRFWDPMDRRAVTRCQLRMLNASGTIVIARSHLATDAWSISRNQDRYYWRGASLFVRKLRELHRLGGEVSPPVARMPTTSPTRPPQNMDDRARLPLLRQGVRLVRFLIRHLAFRDQWALLYYFGDRAPASLEDYKLLRPPRDRFWADPFVVQRRDRYFVFVEEYVYSKERGHIAVIETDHTGRFGQPVELIDEPYHLSYPFVFHWQGSYYLIPESHKNNSIHVYRCVDFPYKWRKHKTLMKGQSLEDATLLHYENRWWLFVNIADHPAGSTWDELFVFHADSPLSDDWEPHARNPVVSDVTRARSAGRIFMRGGTLHRPSQDCSKGYGYGLRFHRIDKLTPFEYEETVVSSIFPSGRRGIRGMHTFNQISQLWMMDAKLRKLRGL